MLSVHVGTVTKAKAADVQWWNSIYEMLRSKELIARMPNRLVFYTVMLPLLSGKPLADAYLEAKDDPVFDYRTPQRTGTCFFRCMYEALHYLLRREGLTKDESKVVRFAMKFELMMMARTGESN